MRRLRDEITVQTRTESKSSSGSATYTWADDYKVLATFHPMGGREARVYGRSYPTAEGVFEMRFNPDDNLNTANRIVWESNNYDIEYIDAVGNRGRRDMLMVVVKRNAD